MLNLDKHPYFKEYIDPKTGVKSYILKERVAQMQQHLYFTDSSITYDEKYMWIRCINAPGQYVSLAVVSLDENNPFIRHFPGMGNCGHCDVPSIIPGTHDVLIGIPPAIYKITPEGEVTKLFELDQEFLKNRKPYKMMTNASVSCDKKHMALDIEMSDKFYIGVGNFETGEIKIIEKFGRRYNHTMFSPHDPNLMLVDQDWWRDFHTGEYFPITNRIWLCDIRGTRFEPLLPKDWYNHGGTEVTHDFWSKDGMICWADCPNGTFECDVETREITHIWKRRLCHCHTSADRSLWVADEDPYDWVSKPCQVLFFDRESGKEIEIFSSLPCPKEGLDLYHIDPHPSFADGDKYIVSTVTLIDGYTDVAITPVEPLLEICRKNGKLAN